MNIVEMRNYMQLQVHDVKTCAKWGSQERHFLGAPESKRATYLLVCPEQRPLQGFRGSGRVVSAVLSALKHGCVVERSQCSVSVSARVAGDRIEIVTSGVALSARESYLHVDGQHIRILTTHALPVACMNSG